MWISEDNCLETVVSMSHEDKICPRTCPRIERNDCVVAFASDDENMVSDDDRTVIATET
jgi:hypothetical protein